MNKNIQTGILLAAGTAVISGLANYLNKFALTELGDPLLLTGLKNSAVAVMLGFLLVWKKPNFRLKKLRKNEIGKLLAVGIIGGSLPFYLFFLGLSQMPAVNAALIHKTLVLWVAILAWPLFKEKISLRQAAALGLIFSANLLGGGYRGMNFGKPETLVWAATILWAVENLVAKTALKTIPAEIVATARMGIGAIGLLAALLVTGRGMELIRLNPHQAGWVMVTAVLLFGYVLTWYRALALAPVITVAMVLSLGTLVTSGLTAMGAGKFSPAELTQALMTLGGFWLFLAAGRKVMGKKRWAQNR